MSSDPNEEMWFVTVLGQRLGPLRSEDIFSQAAFRKKLGIYLGVYPTKLPDNRYDKIVRSITEGADRLPADDSLSAESQFDYFLGRFLRQRARAINPEDIKSGMPWYDPDDGCIYFHSEALIGFFRQHRLDIATRKTWIYTQLNKRGAKKRFFNLKNKEGFNTWGLKPIEQEDDARDEDPVPNFNENEEPF